MRNCIALTVVAVALLSVPAFAAEQEYLVASWENTLDHFQDCASNGTNGNGPSFASIGFETVDGITKGSTSLLLNTTSGWVQGLTSAFGASADWGGDWVMNKMNGAASFSWTSRRTSTASTWPVAASMIRMVDAGRYGTVGFWGVGYGSKAIDPLGGTQTLAWDLSNWPATNNDDAAAALVPTALPPTYSRAPAGSKCESASSRGTTWAPLRASCSWITFAS